MRIFYLLFVIGCLNLIISSCNNSGQNQHQTEGIRILKVPGEFSTIKKAVKQAQSGDFIIISPGQYFEKDIDIDKAVTISSEWKLTGEESKIDETIIDSDDKILFNVLVDSVEISGLRFINGNHTLNIEANVAIVHNHFFNNLDGMSFESGGGGYAGYNTAENDRDDALDLDIVVDKDNSGSDIMVEHNTFINCNDDGIEIRLFEPHNQNVKYTIRSNTIIGSKNAAIQLISYDAYTGKEFYIHHNIFQNCKTGLGCMEGSNTREDLSGATKMDELVCFFNNTLVGNQMGATGGNRIIAFNNLVQGNLLGGFKRFGPKSVVMNNLFYENGGDDFIDFNESVTKEGNISNVDPLLDPINFAPAENSLCIDAGKLKYEENSTVIFELPENYVAGVAPDIGAVELGDEINEKNLKPNFIVNAGEDIILVSPENKTVLKGEITNELNRNFKSQWKLEHGYGNVDILDPEDIQTGVLLPSNGIYQFSFSISDGNVTAVDKVIVRYVNDGDGKMLFLREADTNIVEAEDYAYSYGNVTTVDDPEDTENRYIMLDGSMSDSKASLEYSIGTSNYSNCYIWLLVKNKTKGKRSLNVNFNNKELGEVIVPSNDKWMWIGTQEKVSLTAGQWPVIITNEGDPVLIDKILFSFDEKFNPNI